MSKKIFKGRLLIFAASMMLTGIIFTGAAGAATLTVDDSGGADYTRIQDAINAASAGDIIIVYSGTYSEYVAVNKQLILKGVDNGGGKPVITYIIGEILSLRANGVTLDGFEIVNAKSYNIEYATGVGVYSSNNTIRNNTISSNEEYGIYMVYGSNNTFSDNIISNNGRYGLYQYGGIDNRFYNNIFNNSVNIILWSTINIWNITRTSGANIAGGPYLGGNFWANPGGTGTSQMCTDSNLDGFCDLPYSLDAANTDYLPLRDMPSPDEINAGYYYFDDFIGTDINSTKWNTEIATSDKRWCSNTAENHHNSPGNWINVAIETCNGYTQSPPYGNIAVGGGLSSLSSGYNRAFPYIWSGPPSRRSPFPGTDDFILDVRMKYDNLQPNGDGFMTTLWENTTPVGNNPPIPVYIFYIWAGSSYPGLIVYTLGEQIQIADPLAFHDYRLEYIGGKYSLYVDGVLRAGPTASSLRPNTIWLGNPVFTHWGIGDWTDFTIDYVQIIAPDYIPPATNVSLSGTLGQNDWYTSDVQVTLTAEDNAGGWGVAKSEYSFDGIDWITYTPPLVVNKEGLTALYYRSRDMAGNIESAKNITIKIDKTPPVIRGGITTSRNISQTIFFDDFNDANYDGWTVFEGCLTAQNGYLEKVCTGSGNGARTPVAVDAEVVNLSFDWKIQGNIEWNCQGMAVSLERSPGDPVVTVWPDFCYPWNSVPWYKLGLNIPDTGFSENILLPRDTNWHNLRLNIYHGLYAVYHDGKPVIVAFGPERINSSWITAQGWTHSTMAGSGWDNFKVEAEPIINTTNGWYNTDVMARFVAEDTVSGIDAVTPDAPFAEGINLSASGSAADKAGNSNGTAVLGINVDRTTPDVTINTPVDGGIYILNQTLIADWSAADSLSGIASAEGTLPSGSAIDTGIVGAKMFRVTALDNASNRRIRTANYSITYNFLGFLQPINMDGSSVFNNGSTVPVKFNLMDAYGSYVSTATANLTYQSIGVPGDEVKPVPNNFTYLGNESLYIFNLDTSGIAAGVYQLNAYLDDGTVHSVRISLR